MPATRTRKSPRDKPIRSSNPKTARDIMLDPHGVYGTRTASRLAAAQRRRRTQRALLGALMVLAVVLYAARRFQPGQSALAPVQQSALPAPPAVAPVVVEDAKGRSLLIPLQTGSLWRVPLDATGGAARRIWATGFPASASPLAVGTTIYLPCSDGFLRAVNWRTGRAIWGARMPGTPITQPLLLHLAQKQVAPPSPSVSIAPSAPAGSEPVPPPSSSPPSPQLMQTLVLAGDDAGTLSAYDARSGHLVWMRMLSAPLGSGLRSTTFSGVDEQVVFVPLMNSPARRGGLLCLQARTGKVLWRYGVAEQAGAAEPLAPEVVGSGEGAQVFCADDGASVVALSPRDGHKLWRAKIFLQPLPGAGSDAVVLPRSGPVAWWGTDEAGRTPGNYLAVGGNDGAVRVLDARNGRLLWTFEAGAPLLQPIVPLLRPAYEGTPARQCLLVAPDAPRLRLLDAAQGTPLTEFALDAPIVGAPLIVDDHLVVVTQAGTVLRFDLADGARHAG